ncbi:hypothetical protein [Polaromonas sp.]|uniref:hypothetical protein n=1 Tax=Polaromonas sp. TaxID=1869339 RepID=UPI003CB706A6
MINDDDDHIRRNIVVVSTSILLAAWLELPASSVFGSILPSTISLEPRKLWAVGFAILAYLGVRYRFSSDGQAFTNSFKTQLQEDRNRGLEKLLKKGFREYKKSGKSPGSGDGIEKVVQLIRDGERLNVSDDRPNLELHEHSWCSLTDAEASVLFIFNEKGEKGQVPKIASVSFRWPLHVVFANYLPSWLKALLYSDVAIQKIAPLLLALCAEVVLLLRLTHSYLNIS